MDADTGGFDYRSSGPNALNGYDVAVSLFYHTLIIWHSASVYRD